MIVRFLKSLDADDIFLSYSRKDGSAYVTGLDAALSAKGFSCFMDKRGTDANTDLPRTLVDRIRACKTLVLAATPGAFAQPDNIAEELREFAEENGTARIISVSFDRDVDPSYWSADVPWNNQVKGKAREREAADALATGEPSPSIVDGIVRASNYMKSKDRLRKYRNRAVAGLVVLLVSGLGAGGVASYEFAQAADAAAEAEKQRIIAREESGRAAEAAADAAKQAARAREETERAAKATVEAQRQSDISESRSLANRSQVMLKQRPEELSIAVTLAVKAMRKSLTRGVHTVEADSALRDGLAVLPLLQGSERYDRKNELAPWVGLSPDGRHVALMGSNGGLRIYKSAGQGRYEDRKPTKEYPCTCDQVALSNDLRYAAAVTKGGIRVFDLRDEAKSHLLKIKHRLSAASRIALSPGGRYIAVSLDDGNYDGHSSGMVVLERQSGKLVETFEDTKLLIADVSFGPTGHLAIGGAYGSAEQGWAGRVMLWPLGLNVSGAELELTLTEASFRSPQIIPQRDPVAAVAPGTDDSTFATNKGVWRRVPSARDFSIASYLPYRRKFESQAYITKLAFGPNDQTLMVARAIDARHQNEGDRDEHVLEAWGTVGHKDLTRTQLRQSADRMGFKPTRAAGSMAAEPPGGGRAFAFTGLAGERLEIGLGKVERADKTYVSPDGRYSAKPRRNAVVISDTWNNRTSTVSLGDNAEKIGAASVSADGTFVAFAITGRREDGALTVYRTDGKAYHQSATIPQRDEELQDVVEMALSADGTRLAVHYTYADRFVRIWDVRDGSDASPAALKQPNDILGMALSRNGRFLALTDWDQKTYLLDLAKTKDVAMVTLVENTPMRSMAFSADERVVALGSQDGVVLVFETARPESEIARLEHAGPITAIGFSDDSRYIATASNEPNARNNEETYPLRVWLLQPTDLIDQAEKAVRALSLKR